MKSFDSRVHFVRESRPNSPPDLVALKTPIEGLVKSYRFITMSSTQVQKWPTFLLGFFVRASARMTPTSSQKKCFKSFVFILVGNMWFGIFWRWLWHPIRTGVEFCGAWAWVCVRLESYPPTRTSPMGTSDKVVRICISSDLENILFFKQKNISLSEYSNIQMT